MSRVSEALDGTCGAFGLHQGLCVHGGFWGEAFGEGTVLGAVTSLKSFWAV